MTHVLAVVANGEVVVASPDAINIVVVDLDSIRDYETPKKDIEEMIGSLESLPIGDVAFERIRSEVLLGLRGSEPMSATR